MPDAAALQGALLLGGAVFLSVTVPDGQRAIQGKAQAVRVVAVVLLAPAPDRIRQVALSCLERAESRISLRSALPGITRSAETPGRRCAHQSRNYSPEAGPPSARHPKEKNIDEKIKEIEDEEKKEFFKRDL